MLPRAEKWGLEYTGAGDHKGDLRSFRLFLDSTTGDTVSVFVISLFHLLALSSLEK